MKTGSTQYSRTKLMLLGLALIAPTISHATGEGPAVTSWYTINANQYAQIIPMTGSSPTTTWTGNSTPTLSDIQQVRYSTNFVYLNAPGLSSHIMGPWYLDAGKTMLFPGKPTNQNLIVKIPLVPVPQTGTHSLVTGGIVGLMVNGVALFNGLDAFSYKNSTSQDVQNGPSGGDGYWWRLATTVEAVTFDPAGAHQPGSGQYHYHTNPYGLRYQLGDNLSYNSGTSTYTELTASPTHSPLLGYALDGYPIYGPYGYSTANNSGSGIRRMASGFQLRNGTNGTDNLTSGGRHSLPAWSATTYGHTITSSSQYGPNVSGGFPLGWYEEDYDYLGDHGKVQGTDFDLDQYNGRTCVTPEYPAGTYAYFMTMDSSGGAVFPFFFAGQYYGIKNGQTVSSVSESTTTYFPVSSVTDWAVF